MHRRRMQPLQGLALCHITTRLSGAPLCIPGQLCSPCVRPACRRSCRCLIGNFVLNKPF
jgi:hypothetical protein